MKAEVLECTKGAERSKEEVNKTMRLRDRAIAWEKRYQEEKKENEAKEVLKLSREIDDILSGQKTCYEANVKLRSFWVLELGKAYFQFTREYMAARRTGNTGALKALQRVKGDGMTKSVHK